MSNSRKIKDEDLKVEVSIPAASANVDSPTIDFGQASSAVLESLELEISIPALASLADATSVTVTVQDSADDSTFASVSELATFAVTGAGGAGSAAASTKIRLPSTTKRYVNINVESDSASGDNTASSVTVQPLF